MGTRTAEITSYILERIDKGKLKPGDRLPSRPELVRRFSCARATVDRALSGLKREGIVDCKLGKGTFVSTPRKGPRGKCSVVVLPEPADQIHKQLFVYGIYRPLLRTLGERANAPQLTLEIPNRAAGKDWESMCSARIVYWIRPPHSSLSLMERLKAAGTPQVLLNRDFGDIPCVLTDAAEGNRIAVKYLHSMGHRRIGYVCPEHHPLTAFAAERMIGYMEMAQELGIGGGRQDIHELPRKTMGAEKDLADWLSAKKSPSAVIALSSQTGTLVKAAGLAGRTIPGDLSVLAVDEVIDPSGLFQQKFTCIRQQLAEIGRRAAKLKPSGLMRRGRPLKEGIVPELIEGDSVIRCVKRRKNR